MLLFKCYFDADAGRWIAYQTTRHGDQFGPPVTASTKDHALVLLGRQWQTNPDEGVASEQ